MKRFNIRRDTNTLANPECERCANAECRKTDQKTGLCKKLRSVVDGLPLRCVGSWANDKIYYLLQYFQIFTQGMHGRWRGQLRYVEICSGPGRCSTRDGYEQDGTALAIVKNDLFELLADALFIDYSPPVIDVLRKRLEALGKNSKVHAVVGNYNDTSSLVDLLGRYSPNTLTLCFIDPTDCSVPFETVQSIFKATNGKCDFLISFFDGLDFRRNAVNAALDNSFRNLRSKYERFLGTPDYFERKEIVEAAQANRPDTLTHYFRQHYADKLSAMGLPYQDWKSVRNYYSILFASGHSRGLEFWKKASKCDPVGQSQLELGL